MTTTDSTRDRTPATRLHSAENMVALDATFDALATEECRALLHHLADCDDDALVVDDLVNRLAPDDERRLRARLHHTHLPKLADADLLDYDAKRGLVRPASPSHFETLRERVEAYEASDRPLSVDSLFGLFADARRRAAYATLLDHGELSLPDLADEVAVAERGEPLSDVPADAVLDVYLSLYHTHVPKFADAGLVTYDQQNDYVALTDAGRALESTVRDLCSAVASDSSL